MWPDLAKFRHFGKFSKYLAIFRDFLFGVLQKLQIVRDIFVLNFTVIKGQILDKYSSHLVTLPTFYLPSYRKQIGSIFRSVLFVIDFIDILGQFLTDRYQQ